MIRRASLPALLLSALAACGAAEEPASPSAPAPIATGEAQAAPARPTVYDVRVVAEYPRSETDFTQGLFFADGALYESTGQRGRSQIIRHGHFGAEEARQSLPPEVFGEGSVAVDDRIVTVTWTSGTGFVHDLETLERIRTFDVDGEGWGLTYDGERLILSDGSNRLRFLDPQSYEETGSIAVFANGRPVPRLNELEFVNGEVWANVWQTDVIVRIDPSSGHVTGFIDASAIGPQPRGMRGDVLNGIAYDPEAERLLLTGKMWPALYEVELVERAR